MVRFLCFLSHSLHQKTKKVQHPRGTMHSTLQQKTKEQEGRVNFGSASTNIKLVNNNLLHSSMEQTTSASSHGHAEHLNIDGSKEFFQISCMQKRKSLGSIIDIDRGSSGGNVTDDEELGQHFSYKCSHEKSTDRINSSCVGNTSLEVHNHDKLGICSDNQQEESGSHESSVMIAYQAHRDSMFSIEILKQFDGNQHNDADEKSTDHASDTGCLSPGNHAPLERSHSTGNLRVDTAKSMEGAEPHITRHQSRSLKILHSLNGRAVEFHEVEDVHSPIHVSPYNLTQEYDEGRKGLLCQFDTVKSHKNGRSIEGQKVIERLDSDNQTNIDRYHSHDNITSGNEGEEGEIDDEEIKILQPSSPIQNLDELNPKEYSIRRIEEWISQIDIESGCVVEEPGESSCSFSSPEPQVEVNIPAKKPDARSYLGTEVANNYISSLTATSLSADMVNLGLVAVPFLSAFTSLRVLNLSGNFIVRITAGSLPRGLHMLNLSRNNIAVIEGLRDLTRLRMLDLSYNRIVRIGHGLALCSSLKELYLAGNKISDVEGLHRLLKLNVLDLRGNKISTAKGLSQLAANYNSLQSINLDGNPAQRNVGDEQLKKYLLTLLPNLVYYNKRSIKASGAQEISDRSSSRSIARTEHKPGRRGSRGSGPHKLALTHVQSSHAIGSLPKHSRSPHVESRHVHSPLVASRNPTPIRRNRSEGAF